MNVKEKNGIEKWKGVVAPLPLIFPFCMRYARAPCVCFPWILATCHSTPLQLYLYPGGPAKSSDTCLSSLFLSLSLYFSLIKVSISLRLERCCICY